MKEGSRRLALHRETVRELTNEEATQVRGGSGPTQAVSCQSCAHTLNITACLTGISAVPGNP